jgi:integrase
MADKTLAFLSKLFSWHASRSDEFRSPIVRGMARTKPQERTRSRILSDEELRAIWRATGEYRHPFGPMLRFILLTATRRNEAVYAKRSEITDTEWTIPAARYKTKLDHLIPLSDMAMAQIRAGPLNLGVTTQSANAFIFTSNGKQAIGGLGRHKRAIDEASGVTGWWTHDLRRTARSLMSRAGVSSDHAERCLGHVIGGVRGVYDRHEYVEEKRRAFEALAAQIDRIVNPRDNVVSLVRAP